MHTPRDIGVRRSQNELDVNEWMGSWEAPRLDWTTKHLITPLKAWVEILP